MSPNVVRHVLRNAPYDVSQSLDGALKLLIE